MSTDPAMTPTATGYRLFPGDYGLRPRPRPAHRAVMTAERSLLNFETKAYLVPQPEHGAHYVAAFTPAALLAEYQARMDMTR